MKGADAGGGKFERLAARTGGKARSAAPASSSDTRSAVADCGFHRSKRVVYSSRAASPRVRTASRISAVVRSTLSSCALSNASNAASAAGKLASALRKRRGSATGGFPERLDQWRDAVALQLHRRGIHDEAARYRHDLLDHAQPGSPSACLPVSHKIHDRVGQSHEGRELHGTVELDEVHVHALRREVLARRADVLRGTRMRAPCFTAAA